MKLTKISFEILTVIGRLLRLQGSVTTAQIKRRAIEAFGERSYIKNQVQLVLQWLVREGVLKRVEKGIYEKGIFNLDMQDEIFDRIVGKEDCIALDRILHHPVWQLVEFDRSKLDKYHRFSLGINQVYLEVA